MSWSSSFTQGLLTIPNRLSFWIEVDVDDGPAETVDGPDVDAMVSKIENGLEELPNSGKRKADKVQES
jgi:hypothetical protein